MEFKELVAPSLRELFVKELTENILAGNLSIGERLPNERELAEKMRVSRAVVNGGFKDLRRRGFIKVLPRRGAFVADYKRRGRLSTLKAILEFNGGRFDPVMLDSIYDARINTERHVMRLAARNRTERDIEDLREQITLMEAADSPAQLSAMAHEFYHLLFVASGNLFYPFSADVYGIICVPIMQTLFARNLKDERLEKMRRLLEFIERRDEDNAVECAVAAALWELKEVGSQYSPGEEFDG